MLDWFHSVDLKKVILWLDHCSGIISMDAWRECCSKMLARDFLTATVEEEATTRVEEMKFYEKMRLRSSPGKCIFKRVLEECRARNYTTVNK